MLDGSERRVITHLSPVRLRRVRSFDDILRLLREDLDWPIEASDLEDAVFDYSPEELGLPPQRMPNLVSIRELRPLSSHQPWGIFFLQFTGARLQLTPLRRLLERLVTSKRSGKHHRTWDLDHLLFIITNDSGDAVEFHFVAFFDSGMSLAEIRSLSWRPRQSPERYLRRLAAELLPKLVWPADPDDGSKWSATWRAAFRLRPGEEIKSAAHLAQRMAAVAKAIRSAIASALATESGRGPFTKLLREVRSELVAGVTDAQFADMCAQTLVYGTLSARVTDPVAFGASATFAPVGLTNPFLEALLEQVHDQVAALAEDNFGQEPMVADLDDVGFEQLVADLRESKVEAILDQFGSTAKGGDPVVHFYEEFLRLYDARARIDAGAFYTPQPVVVFMVRAVDEILRSRFGLAKGLADGATWDEVAQHLGVAVPNGVTPDRPFLSMLDPAAGTGTYLVEWLRQARSSFDGAYPSGYWPEHLRSFVLPSMHAFELMLAPYAIAHLKVALEGSDEGVDTESAAVHLTDTLEYPAAEGKFALMDDPVAVEGRRAAELKEHERFTVVIANPPYDREQREVGARGRRKGGVVRYGASGVTRPLLDDITEVMSAAGLGVHTKNLYNDYVYFWRWATWQATQRPPGPGIVAFITASSYLDGKAMAGLRQHLRDVFDEMWIIDLGGEGRGARTEENVFDIRTPVAIAIGIRERGESSCTVHYRRVSGTREDKFAWLLEGGLAGRSWHPVTGAGMDPLVPKGVGDYFDWPEVTDLFPWVHSGGEVKRSWPIAPTKRLLEHRWDELIAAPRARLPFLFKETRDRKVTGHYRSLLRPSLDFLKPLVRLRPGDTFEGLQRYGFRSFDRQWVIADARVADYPRPALWNAHGTKQLYLTTMTTNVLGSGPVVTATPYVPDLHHFSGRGGKDIIPLWRDSAAKQANVTSGLGEMLEDELGFCPSPEDLFAYVYGIGGTSAFSQRFAQELGDAAGPFRVPITSDPALFREVVALGRDLLWWHTWGERFASTGRSALPVGRARQVAPLHGYPERFGYDPDTEELAVGTGRFGPVSAAVWEFEVSGLRVLQSWLGYRMARRKGRRSSALDDIHPERWGFADELLLVVAVLQHTTDVTEKASRLLDHVVASRLIDPYSLPQPTDAERKPPSSGRTDLSLLTG
jgi:hypothetical protein